MRLNPKFIARIVTFTLLLFVSAAMFLTEAWISGILIIAVAAAVHPISDATKIPYKWVISAALFVCAILLQP